ncbi:response regulator [Acaricomes phytoseiuli]|uniref:response regulator n=1 Tax=Acaricomes phytoseiuli TaxID=291968 RepID=UPI000381BA05|nr:response regulator transcription factor [Acaricomes phytoseiuli]
MAERTPEPSNALPDPAAPGAAPIRIYLVDDQGLVRTGFRVILETEPGFQVVGDAADAQTALHELTMIDCDVVCMDVQMPGMDGLEATRRLAGLPQRPAVLMLTTFDRDDYLFAALTLGASGFLLKNTSPERLIEGIRQAAAGESLLAPEVTRRVIRRAVSRQSSANSDVDALKLLTEREAEVLRYVAHGLSNAEIAEALFVGEATVKTHVSKMLMKLGLRDRVHAVIFAYEHGLDLGEA